MALDTGHLREVFTRIHNYDFKICCPGPNQISWLHHRVGDNRTQGKHAAADSHHCSTITQGVFNNIWQIRQPMEVAVFQNIKEIPKSDLLHTQ